MITAATRSTLHEDILHQLYSAVENGLWALGEKLPGEQLLAERFSVSRNCIREAMKVLANRGIVWTKPGSGTFLSENANILVYFARKELNSLREIELKELIETRCLIEGQVAYYAAKRGSDEEFDELETLSFRCDFINRIFSRNASTLISIQVESIFITLCNFFHAIYFITTL